LAAAGAQGPAHPVIRPTHRLGTNRPAPALQAADGVLRDVMQGLLQLAHKVPEPGQPLQPAAGAVARGGAAVVAAEPQVIGRFLEQGWARGLRRVLRHGVRYAGARRAWSQGEVPPLGPDPQCSRRPLGVLRQGAAEDERHAVRLDAEELGHSLEPVRCEAFGLDPVAQLLETGG